MANLKLVKSATALVLGASVLTSAVAVSGTDASAKTTYKVTKGGYLVYAKSNNKVSGYKSYNGKLYKNGKKFTGLYKNKYYKSGSKATGTYKSKYYKAGTLFTGKTASGVYYVKGVKYTGTTKYGYYYKKGVRFTGVTSYGNQYVNGKRVTGEYKGLIYSNGKKVTGLYKEKLYTEGKLETGLDLYKEKLYKDGVLNIGLALHEGKLYKDADLNKGLVKHEDKYYFDADLANGTYDDNGVERAIENGVEVGAKVASVEAINATQVVVTFNKTVDKDSVINSTDQKVKNVTFKSLDGKTITSTDATGELSKDGKTLTITTKASEVFEGRYDVTIDKVKDVNGKDLPTYEAKNLDFGKDTTAPALVGTEKVNSTKVNVNFSEPLASEGSWTFTDANGKAVEATKALASDGLSVEVTITDANLKAGSEVTATILGAKDKAGNVINPNPSTVKFVKGDKDGVAPVVSSVTAKGLDTFELKFSEEVQALPIGSISIDGTALATGTITKDDKDKTKYTVKLTSVLPAGLHKVEVKSATGVEVADLSGEPLTAFSQLVDFKADTVKPAFVSSEVVANADTKKEQLVLNFDKEVTDTDLTNVVTTKLDKELITTNGKLTAGTLIVNPKNKKQLVVDLDTVKFEGADLTKDATYTVKFADGAVKDTNATANVSKAFEVKFKRGEDGTAVTTDKPVVATAVATDSNTVTVTFDKAVDGVTATNVANYSIPGLTIEKAVLNPVSGATQSVTLTLKKGTNTLNGDRVLTIANVKAKNGVVMDTASKTVTDMLENVTPTVTKAQFTETSAGKVTKLTLAFSEKVAVDVDSFEAFVGDDTTAIKLTNTAIAAGAEANEVVVTVESGKEFDTATIAKGITVKLASGKVVQDANKNALDFTSIKAAQ